MRNSLFKKKVKLVIAYITINLMPLGFLTALNICWICGAFIFIVLFIYSWIVLMMLSISILFSVKY